MQGIIELDIVSGSGVGHGTPDFDALSECSNYGRESQSTVAGPPSCASVALRRRLPATPLSIRHTEQCVQCRSSVQVPEMLSNIGVPTLVPRATLRDMAEIHK